MEHKRFESDLETTGLMRHRRPTEKKQEQTTEQRFSYSLQGKIEGEGQFAIQNEKGLNESEPTTFNGNHTDTRRKCRYSASLRSYPQSFL